MIKPSELQRISSANKQITNQCWCTYSICTHVATSKAITQLQTIHNVMSVKRISVSLHIPCQWLEVSQACHKLTHLVNAHRQDITALQMQTQSSHLRPSSTRLSPGAAMMPACLMPPPSIFLYFLTLAMKSLGPATMLPTGAPIPCTNWS